MPRWRRNFMREKRKKFWIDRFQTILFLRIGLYCLLSIITVWLMFSIWDQMGEVMHRMGTESVLATRLARSLLVLLVLAPIMIIDSIKFAHRLVGPLYRFRVTIKALAAGQPVDLVRLRKGDFLHDMQDDFNAMLKLLESRGACVLKSKPTAANAEAETVLDVTGPSPVCQDR
jgi:hypothetical protein